MTFRPFLTAAILVLSAPLWSQAILQDPASNPLFRVSPLPLHYPDFSRIEDAHFEPAFDEGMAGQLKELAAITNNQESATFANTIVPLERSGQLLSRATTLFGMLVAADTNKEREALRSRYSAKFAAHSDAINLNEALYRRSCARSAPGRDC
jgi:peptidyl-dipeptidase Dcp